MMSEIASSFSSPSVRGFRTNRPHVMRRRSSILHAIRSPNARTWIRTRQSNKAHQSDR